MNKKIIVTIDGNIPSFRAHSITTMKMANGFSEVSGLLVEVVTAGSLKSILNRIRFRNINKHYGVFALLRIKFIHHIFSKDWFTKSINFNWFPDKFSKYLRKNKREIGFVYARSFKLTLRCIKENVPVVLETHAKEVKNCDFIEVVKKSSSESFIGIVTIHDNLRKAYLEAGVPKEKVLVLHDGFSSFLFSDVKKTEKPKPHLVATYIGGLYKEKGIREIIELAVKASEEELKIDFRIYGGDSDQVKFWKQLVLEEEISNVEFLGFLPNYLVPERLNEADILLMPYPKLKNFNVMDIESTSPLKLFEYMAAGRPILSTNIPVISSVLEHGVDGFLGEHGSTEDHFRGLLMLYRDVSLRKSMAVNAKTKSHQYSWERRCERLIQFYDLTGKGS